MVLLILAIRLADVGRGLKVVGLDLEAPFVGRDRPTELTVVFVGHAESNGGFSEGVVDLEGADEALDGGFVLALFMVAAAAIELICGGFSTVVFFVIGCGRGPGRDRLTGQVVKKPVEAVADR